MTRRFTVGTPLADMERQMMMVPNFTPRGYGVRTLRRYRPTAADVDCRYCLQHQRKDGCQSRTCPYLAERLEAGAVTLNELTQETIRPWQHIRLKERVLCMARHTKAFYFAGQLHIIRMLDVTNRIGGFADSKWLAAVYLLSAHTELWVRTSEAIWRNQIDFNSIKLDGVDVQDYVLYRVAKGILHGTLGATSEELSDKALVSDDTLLLVLNAALIARYGPEAMKVGRAER